MKKIIPIVICFFFITFLLPAAGLKEKNEYFSCVLQQNGREFVPEAGGGVVGLAKEPFDFVLRFDTALAEKISVHLLVSKEDHFFRGIPEGKNLAEILAFAHPRSQGKAAAEAFRLGAMNVACSLFNPDEELIIHPFKHMGLFYESESMHNFSEVRREGDVLVCRLRVARFRDQSTHTSLPLRELSCSSLYVTLLYTEPAEEGQEVVEKQWETFRIDFTETEE